jgi:periplasmic protein TonB
MYDDLARAERPSALEWLVVNAVIPSVILTLALQSGYRDSAPQPAIMVSCPTALSIKDAAADSKHDVADVLPVLIQIPRPAYPAIMRRVRAEGSVVLRALVNTDGRVDSTSVLVVQATDGAFASAAFRALAGAQFRPAWLGGHLASAWITISIDFTLPPE